MISFILPYRIPIQPHWDGEKAWDAFALCNTPVLAVFDGYAFPEDYPLGGHTVSIQADNSVWAYYAHLAAEGRASGRVRAGDVIGYVSNTGNANKRRDGRCHDDEAHVHFAVGQINNSGGGTIDVAEFFAGADVISLPQPDPPSNGGGSVDEPPFPDVAPCPAWHRWDPDLTEADVRHALDTIWGYASLVEGTYRLTRKRRNQMAHELRDNVAVLKRAVNG